MERSRVRYWGGKGAVYSLYSGGKLGERNDRPLGVSSSVARVGLSFRCAALYHLKSRPPFGVGYKDGEALPIYKRRASQDMYEKMSVFGFAVRINAFPNLVVVNANTAVSLGAYRP
jgi:hypothetical protein